jgi:hypothetical protein
MEILGTNEIGYKEPIKVDNNGHLIISGSTGGGSGGGSAIIPPTTTTGNISGVGAFGKTNGSNTYSPLNLDATGHLLVSASGIENVVLIQGHDGTDLKNVLVEMDGTLRTSNTLLDACIDDSNSGFLPSATMTTTNPIITKGQGVIAVNGELQQVLAYGRHNDGTLHPLECSGDDRLLVDVLELNAGGRITTSTALSSVQVCGWDTATGRFKTLNVNSDGNLQVDILSGGGGGGGGGSESYALTQYYSNATIPMNTQTNLITLGGISVPEIKFFFDTETPFTNFYGIGSNDNTNWFVLYPENAQLATPIPAEANTAQYPTTNGAEPYPRNFIQFVFKHPPKYIRFRNGSATQNSVYSHYIITTN